MFCIDCGNDNKHELNILHIKKLYVCDKHKNIHKCSTCEYYAVIGGACVKCIKHIKIKTECQKTYCKNKHHTVKCKKINIINNDSYTIRVRIFKYWFNKL